MLIKIIVLIVILACVGPFFIEGPDGEPLLRIEDFMPSSPDLPDVAPAEPVTVYKWQDENGVWQFSTEPVEGVDAETMELDGSVTVMEALDPRELRRLQGDEPESPSFNLPSGLMTVAPDKVEEMMDAANNLQSTIDERKEEVDKQVGKP